MAWHTVTKPKRNRHGCNSKKNGKNYCSFGLTLNVGSLTNSLKSLKTSVKLIPSCLQERDKTHKS